MKRSLIALAAVMALAAVGCSSKDSTSPNVPSLTGRWTGMLMGADAAFTLVEGSQGSVTGTLWIVFPGVDSLGLAVAGTHTHPAVAFNLTATGYQPATFVATMPNDNSMRGVLNGSGFVNDSLAVTRSN